jgi:hypothetical protein
MNGVVYLSRTTGNYDDEWLELLQKNLDEMNVVVYVTIVTSCTTQIDYNIHLI